MESKAIDIKIVIPTAGRADIISTHRHINNCLYCCSESEAPIYKDMNPEIELITHPDTIKNLGLKRQWIYDKFGDVFMVDDDALGLRRAYYESGKDQANVSPADAYQIIQNAGNVASMAGCSLFGFYFKPTPFMYHGHAPIKLSGFITGSGLGLLKSGRGVLKFNPEIYANNDYFICGLNAFHFRKSWIDMRFFVMVKPYAAVKGGAARVRSKNTEMQDYEILKMNFGEAVVPMKNSRTKVRHEWAKTLKIPF